MNEILKNKIRSLTRGPREQELLDLIEEYLADPNTVEAQLRQELIGEKEASITRLENTKTALSAELAELRR